MFSYIIFVACTMIMTSAFVLTSHKALQSGSSSSDRKTVGVAKAEILEPTKVIGVYHDTTPVQLFRIISGKSGKIVLREKDAQLLKGSRSFDFQLKDGIVLPISDFLFEGPNGMSLRPRGMSHYEILAGMKGEVSVCEIPRGEEIPAGLVLVHEHSDHYSMQTDIPCTAKELNKKLTEFLSKYERYSREEWFVRFPI